MLRFFLLLLIGSFTSVAFAQSAVTGIIVGPGPEDVVLDTFTGASRLLVSSTERRNNSTAEGAIFSVSLDDSITSVMRMPFKQEPECVHLRPHGIDLVKDTEGRILLYVISHEPGKQKEVKHFIHIYEVHENHLLYLKTLSDPLLISPNDLSALPTGEIYITNDSGKKTGGTLMERLFQQRKSNVVYVDGNGKWSIAADKIAYANGIKALNDKVIVAPTQKKELLMYKRSADGKLGEKKVVAKLKGLDNITWLGNDELIVAAHPKFMPFIKHYKKSENKSPGIVYKVNVETGLVEILYKTDGSSISANSVAVTYKGALYIGQVFDPFLLKVFN